MKESNINWSTLKLITAINVMVATGYSIAGMIAPETILPTGTATGDGSFIFSLYAAARTLPLAILTLICIFKQNKSSVVTLAILAGSIQFADAMVGFYQLDLMKTAGALFLSIAQFVILYYFRKSTSATD